MKLSRIASERCEDARREFGLEIGQYPVEYLVWGDEASDNISDEWMELEKVEGSQAL